MIKADRWKLGARHDSRSDSALWLLGVDAACRAKLENALKRIPSLKIGENGHLQEWSVDYEEANPNCVHVSHLLAIFPEDEITLRGTLKLAAAARVSLEQREEHGAGMKDFPLAWYANLWARLDEGNRANQHIQNLPATLSQPRSQAASGVFASNRTRDIRSSSSKRSKKLRRVS